MPRNAFAVWPCCGSSSAASSAEVCALLFPPFRSASGADIAACAVCVMLPAGAATLARFLEGSHRNVLGRVSANTGRSGKVVGVGDAFDERGQGEGVGEEGSLGALFGRAFRSAHAVCGLSGGFAQPCVLNASEVLPGCKNARAAARALGLAPPTTRGCSRVHNTPKGVLSVSERAFDLCMASSTRECEVE